MTKFNTEHDYENPLCGYDYLLLQVEVDYIAHKEVKRTYDYPGEPAYIETETISLIWATNENGKQINLSPETIAFIEKDLEKVEWDGIIGEYLEEEYVFAESEHYDRKWDELRGC